MEETLIGFCALLLTALGGTLGYILKAKTGKAINPNPSLPPGEDATHKSGDMAVAYWQLQFSNLHAEMRSTNEKLDAIITLLKEE